MFGGTFDPIHVGHLVAAVNVRHALSLDRVLFVVANLPWQKAWRPVSSAEDRYDMVAATLEGVEGLEPSRIELDRGGESYTADTLEQLVAEDPSRELFLIVGADVAGELITWRRMQVAQDLATLVVVDRPGADEPHVQRAWRVRRVAIPHLEVSSSDLRARVADGRPLDWLVPAPAMAHIRQRGLYAGAR